MKKELNWKQILGFLSTQGFVRSVSPICADLTLDDATLRTRRRGTFFTMRRTTVATTKDGTGLDEADPTGRHPLVQQVTGSMQFLFQIYRGCPLQRWVSDLCKSMTHQHPL